MPSIEKKKPVNVASASADGEKISNEIRELKELVLGVNEKIHELEKKAKTTATSQCRRDVVSYACRRQGHFARDCPHREARNGARGLPRAIQSP